MILYLYYLIRGPPGGGVVVPEFLKLAFKCMERYSNHIVSLLIDQGSTR